MFAASQRIFVGTSTALFAATTGLTIAWCREMSAMHDMPMPGGWNMSMMWMPMAGQDWASMAMAFLGMWLVMMTAMMLPALVPMLLRYRRAHTAYTHARVEALTALVGAAYFGVWTLFGAGAFVVGALLTSLEMQLPLLSRVVPAATAVIVLGTGLLQFSPWKARQLERCREMPGCCAALRGDAGEAWRHGLRLGVNCVRCCLALTVMLLAVGVMDLRAMALVTAAISVERLAPGGTRAARFVGAILVAAGLYLIVCAAAG